MTTDTQNIPRCPNCGLYFFFGMLHFGLIRRLKAEYGWKIGRIDIGVPKRFWAAYAAGQRHCHTCPRCHEPLEEYFESRDPRAQEDREREARINRHPVLSLYPHRYSAEFTIDNDHNPLVREECPCCDGSGEDPLNPSDENFYNCTECEGLGFTGRAVKYFANEEPAISVTPNPYGFIKCTNCNWRFLPSDKFGGWTGLRCKRCGQKILIVERQTQ